MDEEIDSLDGQAKFFVAVHAPCSTIETLLGIWNTIGIRGANAYLKAEPTPNRKITYTQIPPRLLSETETRALYGVSAEESQESSVSVIRNEGQTHYIEYLGDHIHLKSTKGVRMLAHLLTNAMRQYSAIELRTVIDGHPIIPDQPETDLGSESGLSIESELLQEEPALDHKAVEEIKIKVQRLIEERKNAEELEDFQLAAEKETQMYILGDVIAKSRSSNRRRRRTRSPQLEKARQVVWSNLKKTIAKIESELPELGAHLAKSLVYGTNCYYDPGSGSRSWKS